MKLDKKKIDDIKKRKHQMSKHHVFSKF